MPPPWPSFPYERRGLVHHSYVHVPLKASGFKLQQCLPCLGWVLCIRVRGQSQFPYPSELGLQHVTSKTFPHDREAQSNEGTHVQGLALKQLVKPHTNHIIGSWLPLASFIQAQHGQLRTNCVWLLRGWERILIRTQLILHVSGRHILGSSSRMGLGKPPLGFSSARALSPSDSCLSLVSALNPWQGTGICFHKTNLFFHLSD